jgi:hypothetical protein
VSAPTIALNNIHFISMTQGAVNLSRIQYRGALRKTYHGAVWGTSYSFSEIHRSVRYRAQGASQVTPDAIVQCQHS